jgi:hypothetical protein
MAAVAAVSVAVVGFGLLWFLDGGNESGRREDHGAATVISSDDYHHRGRGRSSGPCLFADTDGPGRQDGPF